MSRAVNEFQDDKESLKHESLFFMALKTLKQQLERERLEHEQQLIENQRKTLLVHFLLAQRCTEHNWIQLGSSLGASGKLLCSFAALQCCFG